MKGFTAAAVLMALAALSVGAAGAHANSSQQLPTESDSHTGGGGGGGGGGGSSCEFPHWSKAPRIVIHTAQFNRGGAQPGDEADMVNAVQQVANEFSDTPDLSARITSVTTTTDPYYYGVWVNDSVPTIHVRFSPESAITDDNHGEAAAGLTTPNIDWGKCTISEAHIEFAQPFDTAWNYGTPDEAKVPWYDTSELVGTDTWFRPSFLHELLHAFGFKHTTNHYSFMNHRFPAGFPWAGGHDNGVRMLPWEVGVLRDAYGDTGSDFGIGLRNTWYGTPQPNDDAASQEALCPDSSVWNDTTNRCKTSSGKGFREICAGDTINADVAVANYSTSIVAATVRLYFSKDDAWSTDDIPSSTTHTRDVSAELSAAIGGDWKVPAGLAAGPDYYAIARVEAVPNSDPSQTGYDAIPLRIPVGSDGADRDYHNPGTAGC